MSEPPSGGRAIYYFQGREQAKTRHKPNLPNRKDHTIGGPYAMAYQEDPVEVKKLSDVLSEHHQSSNLIDLPVPGGKLLSVPDLAGRIVSGCRATGQFYKLGAKPIGETCAFGCGWSASVHTDEQCDGRSLGIVFVKSFHIQSDTRQFSNPFLWHCREAGFRPIMSSVAFPLCRSSPRLCKTTNILNSKMLI